MNSSKDYTSSGLSLIFIAIAAALFVQLFHEVAHGVIALWFGAEWIALSLFAADWAWPDEQKRFGTLAIEGGPALLNIILGAFAISIRDSIKATANSLFTFFWFYVACFSLFMGFGYLFFDAFFYQDSIDSAGDWQKVISLLGGGLTLRVFLVLVGGGGLLFVYFWIPKCAFESMIDFDQRTRVKVSLMVMMTPYLVVNSLFMVLSFWHPFGSTGVIITSIQYWFGNIGLFWAFFMTSYWLNPIRKSPTIVALPVHHLPALIITTLLISVVAYLTLPFLAF